MLEKYVQYLRYWEYPSSMAIMSAEHSVTEKILQLWLTNFYYNVLILLMINQSKINQLQVREISEITSTIRGLRNLRWILLNDGFPSSTEHLNASGSSYIGYPRTPRGDMKSLAFKILPPRSIQTTTHLTPLFDYYYTILSPDDQGADILMPATTFLWRPSVLGGLVTAFSA